MKNKNHYNVVIATPGRNFSPGYIKSLLSTISVLHKENISWTFLNEYSSLVSMAREVTIGGENTNDIKMNQPQNGDFTYDKIFWIDSDIEWTPTDFFKLYNSKKDIISGCYLMENRNVPVYDKPRGVMMSAKDLLGFTEEFKAVAVGFGFLCVKSGVFESMPRPWFGPVAIPNLDSNKKTDPQFILVGEDISWCIKAEQSGFEVWVDPKVRVTHEKTFKILWDDLQ